MQTADWVSAPVFVAICTMNPIATFQLDQPSLLSTRSCRRSDRQLENVHRFELESFRNVAGRYAQVLACGSERDTASCAYHRSIS